MAEERVQRRLAAILAADMVGYSRLMQADEEATIARLKAYRAEVIDPFVTEHQGRIVKTSGDGMLVEFASVVGAVKCAVEIQRALAERDRDMPEDRRIRFRIGVNLGDIVVDGDDILGDGVNIAARLEGLAEPGGICIPRKVFDEVRNKLDVGYTFVGDQSVKNIAAPVAVYRVNLDAAEAGNVVGENGALRPRPHRRNLMGVAAAVLLIGAAGFWYFGLRQGEPTVTAGRTPAVPNLSIIVLPFANLSGDAAQEYFADAITEDLISDLSRIRGAFVIARGTSFTYRGKVANPTDVARQLGVRYVLEGSARRSSNQVRVNVRLVDGANGVELWSAKLDRAYENIFALQSEITGRIAAVLKVELLEAESRRAGRVGPTNLQAWDYAVQAQTLLHHSTGLAKYSRALSLFKKSIDLDPDLALAWEGISFIHYVAATRRLPGVTGDHLRLVLEAAKKAVSLDPKSSDAQIVLGLAHVLNKQPEVGLNACTTAVELNRNNDDAYICLAQAQRALGRYSQAIDSLEKSRQLNPRFRPWRRDMLLGANWALLGNQNKALAALTKAVAVAPNHQVVRMYLVAVLAMSGRLEEARKHLAVYMQLAGEERNTVAKLRLRNSFVSPHYDRILEGLRKAGLPEK